MDNANAGGTPSVISARSLVKTYVVGDHQVKALRGVNIEVPSGEFLAVTGPSGSGKSTFMHIVGCLDKPTSGQYFLDGQDVSTMSKNELAAVRNKKIGFVFQGFNLLSRTSALDNVELPLLYGGSTLKTSERHRLAKDMLAAVGLGDRFSHHPNQLSGGQQQRVAIARALINNPSILLADEPTGNLDSRTSIEVMGLFQRLNIERGITVVLITHEADIAEYGTRIVSFRDGVVKTDRAVTNRRTAADELAQPARGRGGSMNGEGKGRGRKPRYVFLMVLRVAFKALARNKMRTALTMLGMIIGVSAVITMVALGTGAQSSIESQIQAAGTNMIMVSAGNFQQGGVRMGQGNASSLTPEDALAIQEVPGVQYIAPGVNTRGQVVAGNMNWGTQIQGTDVDLPLIRSWPTTKGAFFSPVDVVTASKVAVLGSVVHEQLFGADVDPVGEVIRINNQPFTVVGVMASKGQSGMGQDQDDEVYVPYTTVMKKLRGITYIQNITVSATSAADTTPTAERIATLLRGRHQIVEVGADDFMVRTMEEMASVRLQATETMTALLASIAGVSLLVGGIGIMNIMLVSVTERTREIGLRMAIGARGRDVLLQFLVEAVVLSLFGGSIGIALGLGMSKGVTAWMTWPTKVSAESIAVAFVFAAVTGVFFGFYPARKAAALDPIDALRFE